MARRIALRKLAVRAQSRAELERAFRERNVPDETAADVLQRFTEVGLVDDQRLARDWVDSRRVRRHLSRTALRHELSAKGVSGDDIDTALEGVSRDEELRVARMLGGKKLATMGSLEPEVQKRRVAGALARRGFSSDVIGRVLADLIGG